MMDVLALWWDAQMNPGEVLLLGVVCVGALMVFIWLRPLSDINEAEMMTNIGGGTYQPRTAARNPKPPQGGSGVLPRPPEPTQFVLARGQRRIRLEQ